jgi:hypothetical protein
MKNFVLATAVASAVAVFAALTFSAMADTPNSGNGTAATPASSSGTDHGAFADQNGNFGFIGQDFQGAPNIHGGAVGQEPGATGYNNSNVPEPPVITH